MTMPTFTLQYNPATHDIMVVKGNAVTGVRRLVCTTSNRLVAELLLATLVKHEKLWAELWFVGGEVKEPAPF